MARWATKFLSALILSTLCLAVFAPTSVVLAQQATPATPGAGSSNASLTEKIIGGFLSVPLKTVSGIAEFILVPIFQLLVQVSSTILNFSIDYTFRSTNLITGNSGDIINFGWTLVRDLCNMVFIFVLIFSSIEVILGRGDAKKTITNIIVAALIVNFSLFFTKLMLDASNLIGATFYAGIKNVVDAGLSGSGLSGIADFIGVQLQVANLYTSSTFNLTDSTLMVLSAFIRIALQLTIAFTFFQIALIFLGRLATIFFLMIFSPLGFVGLVLPQLKGFANKWWEEMRNVLFVMPTFLFTLYIIIRLIGSTQFTTAIGPATGGIAGLGFSIEQYFAFFLVIFLLKKALETAKSMSNEFGNMALKAGNTVAGLALGASVGGAAMLGRATIGRAALNLTKNEAVKNTLRNTAAGRLAFKGLDGVASASFDVRNSDKAKSAVGALGLDLSLGKDKGKGGVKERDEAEAKDAAKFYGKIGLADNTAYEAAKKAKNKAKEDAEKAKEAHDEIYAAYKEDAKSSDDSVRRAAEEKIATSQAAMDAAAKTSVELGQKFNEVEKGFIKAQEAFVEKLATPNIVTQGINKVTGGLGTAAGRAAGMAAAVVGPTVTEAPVLGSILKSLKTDPDQIVDAEELGKAFGDAISDSLKIQEKVIIEKLRDIAKETDSKKKKKEKDKKLSETMKDAVKSAQENN